MTTGNNIAVNELVKLYRITAIFLLVIAAVGTAIALPRAQFMQDDPIKMPIRFDHPGIYLSAFTTSYDARYIVKIRGNDPANGTLNPHIVDWSIKDSNGHSVEKRWENHSHYLGEFQGSAGAKYHLKLTIKQPQPPAKDVDPFLLIGADTLEMEQRGISGILMLGGAVFTVLLSAHFFRAAGIASRRGTV